MSSRRILVIEDNPISQRLVRMTLAGEGCTIVEAEDARTALSRAQESAPDLILLDLGLPDMDGLDLLKKLRELPGVDSVPVIAVSGYIAKLEQARQGGAGFADILAKPIEPDMLLQAVETHLPKLDTAGLPGRARRVLVADDDQVQLRLLTRRLEQLGFLVTTADTGSKALEEIRRSPPNAVVADLLMPQPDGFRLCLLVRQDPALAQLPVVLATSSYIDVEDQRLGESVGANAVVVRTPGFENVVEALLAALRGDAPSRPATSGEMLEEQYSQRVLHQLERRAALNIDLTHRCSLQAAELALLAGISESLAKQVAPNVGLVLEQCLDAGGISAGAVFELIQGRLVKKAAVGFSGRYSDSLERWLGARLEETFRQDGPRAITLDPPSRSETRALLAQLSVASIVIVPLVSQDERVGVLALASQSKAAATEDWLTFVRNVAAQLGQALALTRSFARVAESESRYRDLVEGLEAIVWEADANLTFSFVNRRAEQILGFPREQWTSEPDFCARHIHPEDRDRTIDRCRAATAEGRDHGLDYRMIAADGRVVWLQGSVRVLKGPEGQPVALRAVTVDVTTQKEQEKAKASLEAQLRQAQKMEAVGRLAGGVAHDFNNLLSAIMGYSDLVLTRLRCDDPLRHDVDEIRKAGVRATALTRQLLVFSRHQVIAVRVIDPNAIVNDMEKMLARLIGEDIELRVLPGRGLGRIKADASQIEQVILNLCVNARDAMPRGGRLTIETVNTDLAERPSGIRGPVKPGHYVMLAVSDTGTGMSKEVLSHLFEPFFTTKEVGKGTGLGLSTVYGIVQGAGGHVSVYSEIGKGSTFKVYLPRVEEELDEERQPRHEATVGRGSETILLVEDDELVRQLAHRILELNGYHVIVASNGGAALLACEKHEGFIHMMLTDMVMPQMSGKELAERLVKLRPRLKVLFFSGYTSGVALHDDMVGSGRAFIQKPFTPDALARKVREVLDTDPHPTELVTTDRPSSLAVLVAEDDGANQRLIKAMLNRLGHTIDLVASGREVIEALERRRYDVAFLDLQMPDLDGLEACRRICAKLAKEQRPTLVAMTGHAADEDRARCLAAGMDDYLSKPVSLAALGEVLARSQRRKPR